jgi:hypothetical protein
MVPLATERFCLSFVKKLDDARRQKSSKWVAEVPRDIVQRPGWNRRETLPSCLRVHGDDHPNPSGICLMMLCRCRSPGPLHSASPAVISAPRRHHGAAHGAAHGRRHGAMVSPSLSRRPQLLSSIRSTAAARRRFLGSL